MTTTIIKPSDGGTPDDLYNPSSSFSFNIQIPDRTLKRGSIMLMGEQNIRNNDGTALVATDNVFYDSRIGAHGLIKQISVSINGKSQENNPNYPLTVKARLEASNYDWAFMSQLNHNNALMIGKDNLVPALMSKNNTTNNQVEWTSFALAPYCPLNLSDVDISGAKGEMQIDITLNSASEYLYGADSANFTYQLRNLRVMFQSEEGNKNNPVVMSKVSLVPQNLTSNVQQFSVSTPLVCSGVSCVFTETGKSALLNAYELQTLPNLQYVSYNFNGLNNAYIKHDLNNIPEWLLNYLSSWGLTNPTNSFSLERYWNEGQGFGLGLSFGEDIDLAGQQWQMTIASDVANNRPYRCHMMFHGLIEV